MNIIKKMPLLAKNALLLLSFVFFQSYASSSEPKSFWSKTTHALGQQWLKFVHFFKNDHQEAEEEHDDDEPIFSSRVVNYSDPRPFLNAEGSTLGLHDVTLSEAPLSEQTQPLDAQRKAPGLLSDSDFQKRKILGPQNVKKSMWDEMQEYIMAQSRLGKKVFQSNLVGGGVAVGLCQLSKKYAIVSTRFGRGSLGVKTKTLEELLGKLKDECRENQGELVGLFVPK